ncbi:hypothetical protein ABWH91_01085 [Phycisphaerales bacterium ac7]
MAPLQTTDPASSGPAPSAPQMDAALQRTLGATPAPSAATP